jgi:hypothetical protein
VNVRENFPDFEKMQARDFGWFSTKNLINNGLKGFLSENELAADQRTESHLLELNSCGTGLAIEDSTSNLKLSNTKSWERSSESTSEQPTPA